MTVKAVQKGIAEAKAKVRSTVTELVELYPMLPEEKQEALRGRLEALAREMREECERIAKGDTVRIERPKK